MDHPEARPKALPRRGCVTPQLWDAHQHHANLLAPVGEVVIGHDTLKGCKRALNAYVKYLSEGP